MAHTGTSEFISGSSVTAGEIREIREREKREMRGLNDRLAAYIEQVRFLEAQNRKLNHDLERLTKGKHAPGIRMMYEKEITQSQSIIAGSKRDYGNTEKERMNYEHQAQALIEECKLIATSNNVKMDKYKYQDTTEENRAIFRQGLLEAIAEIRKLYDEDTSKFRSEMESWYSKQVIGIRTSSRLAADATTTKEVAPDGSSITIENTSVSHDEMIGEWRLRSCGAGRDV
ncbi:unnamed protein product, partial [Strongylus vulgaris]